MPPCQAPTRDGTVRWVKDLSRRVAFLVHFGYGGAAFYGLQPQPGLPTAGGALADRLAAALHQRPRGLAFAARTDRGVHCEDNLATFWVPRPDLPDVAAACAAIAADADDGLFNVRAEEVEPTVHARGISRGKRYRYCIADGLDDVTDHPRRWEIVPTLDVDRMQEAAAAFIGTHDFSSLRGGGCTAATAVKTIFRLECVRVDDEVIVDVVGDAFLRHMMRNLVGLLVEVGTGWRPSSTMPSVLAAGHRQAAGLMAPAPGLSLMQVGCAWPPDGSGLLPELRSQSLQAED